MEVMPRHGVIRKLFFIIKARVDQKMLFTQLVTFHGILKMVMYEEGREKEETNPLLIFIAQTSYVNFLKYKIVSAFDKQKFQKFPSRGNKPPNASGTNFSLLQTQISEYHSEVFKLHFRAMHHSQKVQSF